MSHIQAVFRTHVRRTPTPDRFTQTGPDASPTTTSAPRRQTDASHPFGNTCSPPASQRPSRDRRARITRTESRNPHLSTSPPDYQLELLRIFGRTPIGHFRFVK